MKAIGWDIGGANVKAALLTHDRGKIVGFQTATRSFEVWREKERLPSLLRNLHEALRPADAMAVTMTAEISDAFRNKREGVRFVLDCVKEAFPGVPLYAIDLDGKLIALDREPQDLLAFAATNWIAEGLMVAEWCPSCLLLDIGSTTTDIVPVLQGGIVTRGKTDTDRLISGELVYTGVLRTPVSAVVSQVPVKGLMCRVSPELFAVMADVYLILGDLTPDDYTCETPDHRGKTRMLSCERLARTVCADATILTEEELVHIARYIHEKQTQQIVDAMMQVLSRIEGGATLPLITTGSGEFLAERCARRLNLRTRSVRELFGTDSALLTPCLAAAYLLAKFLGK